MKKLIATLLSVSVVLAMTGCTKETEKEEEETTTKATTEATSEESTEDTTTETSESETSESTEETTPAPTPEVVDVEYIRGNVESHYSAYANRYDDGTMTIAASILAESEGFYFWHDVEVSDLENAVNAVMQPKYDMLQQLYSDSVDAFVQGMNNGSLPMSAKYSVNTVPFREDSQILSFSVTQSPDQVMGQQKGYNFYSPTGELLSFDDVITDKDAFKEYCLSELAASGKTYDAADIESRIDQGTLEFTMTYNSVVVLLTFVSNDTLSSSLLALPVFGHQEMFNLEYFGSAPQAYTLFPDCHDEVIWDFDEDGVLDTCSVLAETDDYDMGLTMEISWLGASYNSNRDLPDIYGEAVGYCFLNDGNDWFAEVYVVDEGTALTYVYKLEDDITFIDVCEGIPECLTFINPQTFYIGSTKTILGRDVTLYSDAFCLYTEGIPDTEHNRGKICYEMPFFTKTEITGYIMKGPTFYYDNEGEVTIPKDSAFAVTAYDENMLIVEVLNENPEDNYYVMLVYMHDELGYNSVPVSDAIYD